VECRGEPSKHAQQTPPTGALFPLPLTNLTLLASESIPGDSAAQVAESTRDEAVGSVRVEWDKQKDCEEMEQQAEEKETTKRGRGSTTPLPNLGVPTQKTTQKTPQKSPRKSPQKTALKAPHKTPVKTPGRGQRAGKASRNKKVCNSMPEGQCGERLIGFGLLSAVLGGRRR
jgi:hypothetical protein